MYPIFTCLSQFVKKNSVNTCYSDIFDGNHRIKWSINRWLCWPFILAVFFIKKMKVEMHKQMQLGTLFQLTANFFISEGIQLAGILTQKTLKN